MTNTREKTLQNQCGTLHILTLYTLRKCRQNDSSSLNPHLADSFKPGCVKCSCFIMKLCLAVKMQTYFYNAASQCTLAKLQVRLRFTTQMHTAMDYYTRGLYTQGFLIKSFSQKVSIPQLKFLLLGQHCHLVHRIQSKFQCELERYV